MAETTFYVHIIDGSVWTIEAAEVKWSADKEWMIFCDANGKSAVEIAKSEIRALVRDKSKVDTVGYFAPDEGEPWKQSAPSSQPTITRITSRKP